MLFLIIAKCRFYFTKICRFYLAKKCRYKVTRYSRAIHYTYNIYHKLTRYHLDGRYRIDNNLAENSIRPIACGRKNYLFCGNDDAAEDAAVIYSLMGCCKAAGVDFRKWLQYVLSHIHEYDHDLSLDLADFLPDNLKESGVL